MVKLLSNDERSPGGRCGDAVRPLARRVKKRVSERNDTSGAECVRHESGRTDSSLTRGRERVARRVMAVDEKEKEEG